jgi:hypothetical protein
VLYLSTQELQTGLFSATVATMISISIQDLQPSSQDTSAFYLASIYQLLSNENGSHVVIPSSLPNPAASFTAPTSAVWVNSLWFSSLVISLTCALLATLLQQWARRYLRITNPPHRPRKRARIRAFFAEGVERLHLSWTVEAVTTLLHISLFFFLAGLCVFLFGVHQTVFKVSVAWVGLCVVVYASVTALPMLYKDSLYHAPLSTFIWFCIARVRCAFLLTPNYPPRHTATMPGSFATRDPEEDRHQNLRPRNLLVSAEEYASRLPAEIDYRALSWTFDSLSEDLELEEFFDGVPGFCNSNAVDNPVGGFIKANSSKLSDALTGLMDRTLQSRLLSEAAKRRRIIICTRAINAANLVGPWWILPRVLLGEWQAFLKSVDFGLFLKDWSRVDRPITAYYAQCVVAVIISTVQAQARDDRWVQLVTCQIKVSKYVLRRYFTHGDSILLANLNDIVRQTLQISSDIADHYETFIKDASSMTLESLCKLDARDTLPELQHEFCKLWNELVDTASRDQHLSVHNISLATLKDIRKVYISLHEDTHTPPDQFAAIDDSDAALLDVSSYPECTIDHHAPSVMLPNVQGQPSTVGGDAFQPPGFHPTTMPIAFPIPFPAPTQEMQGSPFFGGRVQSGFDLG